MHRKRQSMVVISDDDDDGIFENRLKNISILKSPSKERKIENTSSEKNKTAGSIKMKLRRSTEQSNYKVERLDVCTLERRASLRKTIIAPTRFRSDSDSDYSTRSKKISSDDDSSRNSTPRKNDSQSTVLRSITPRTTEKFRKSLRISSLKDDEKMEEDDFDETNKENESEDSCISDIDNNLELITNRRPKTRKPQSKESLMKHQSKDLSATPKKIQEVYETPSRRAKSRSTVLSTPKSTKKLFDDEVSTPKHQKTLASKVSTPSVKIKLLTPSMRQRTANVAKPKTILEEARAQLHVSAVPKSLPCREKEFNDIFMFLEKKISDHSSGCMYISGVPGTGKTATVNEVIRCLKKLFSKGSLPDFDFIEINGMKLSEPRQSYVQILKQMTGKSTTWEESLKILDKRFSTRAGKKSMTLLLIDELDILCNKRQDVVYNLLNWPSQPAAQLVVITIANTMDLPERVLMSRVTSRLGLTRLTFQPYNHKQLNEIVIARLNESDAFKSEAVQLVARKVAAVSGDARRALDICRRATEIAELHQSKIVSLQHVNEALTEMIASVKVRAIKHCSEMEKVFLQAVCAEIMRTGVEETTFINVYKQLEALCSFEGVAVPSVTQGLEICNRLSSNRLLLCDDPRCDILQRIFLNVSSDDVHFALQEIEF